MFSIFKKKPITSQDITLKKIEVPETNNTKEVDVVELWEVRWVSIKFHKILSVHLMEKDEMQVFVSEQIANEFKDALLNAHKLLKNSGNALHVTVQKHN